MGVVHAATTTSLYLVTKTQVVVAKLESWFPSSLCALKLCGNLDTSL